MVNGAPQQCTISPQPHRPRWSDAAATQVLSGLGPGGPVLYASDLAGPGAKERLVRLLLAGLPGREPDSALPADDPEYHRPGPAAPAAERAAGTGDIVFSGRRSPLGRHGACRPGGRGRRPAIGVRGELPLGPSLPNRGACLGPAPERRQYRRPPRPCSGP